MTRSPASAGSTAGRPGRPTARGRFGAVATTHWRATRAAMEMLEAGGNAFDAAATGAFVLHVVEPHLNGPGGDMPAVFATAAHPAPVVLCGQGPLPAAATTEYFQRLGLDLVPGSGPLAAVVPRAVDAWLMLVRDHGTAPLSAVLAPAATLARRGHPLLPAVASTISAVAQLFTEHWPTSAALWMVGGRAPAPWQWHRNPVYADVLDRLIAAGTSAASREAGIDAAREVWREGFVARDMAAFQRRPWIDSSGTGHPGLLTEADLAGSPAFYEAAAVGSFRGLGVAKTGTWGQGPVLLQALAILDGFTDAELDLDTAGGVHRCAEALKLAFADREAYYGDGAETPLAALLDPAYSAARRLLIGESASAQLRPGRPGGRVPRLPGLHRSAVSSAASAASSPADGALGEPTVGRYGQRRGDTCHIDVVDHRGNIISATPSGGWLQSSPVVPSLGFCLGSRAQMTWVEPGLASSLPSQPTPGTGPRPARRPRTTLSPTLIMREGVPIMACGTPGGDQQDQWQLLFLLRHFVEGLGLADAVDAPAFHSTSFPSSFFPREVEPGGLVVESRLRKDVRAELRRRGHVVTEAGPWSLGRVCVVARDPFGVDAPLSGAATTRGSQAGALVR